MGYMSCFERVAMQATMSRDQTLLTNTHLEFRIASSQPTGYATATSCRVLPCLRSQ